MKRKIATINEALLTVVLMALSLVWAVPSLAATEFMPVPVIGDLDANPVYLTIGKVTEVTFTVVPSEELSSLKLSIIIPLGVERVGGDLSATYRNVTANEVIELQVRLLLNEHGPKRVVASATLFEATDFALSKAFVIDLNPAEKNEPKITRSTDADGGKIRVQAIQKD
jgi:hypothetical protein